MARKTYTLRLEDDLYGALSALSSVTHQSMNRLICAAVAEYVVKRGKPAAQNLEKTLEQLRNYAAKDPGFKRAITAFTEAEIQHDDPVEGTVVVETDAQSEIRNLLGNG